MEELIKQADRLIKLSEDLQKVGEELGAAAMLSVIGTAIDEFATREGIGQEGAREMLERLMTVQGDVWKIERDFYRGGSQWKD